MNVDELPINPVNATSPVPLYHQIENDLRRLIRTGVFLPDDLLPPENDLCRVYGVGRHTMRMALSRLVADRLIERKAGRGTVVIPQPDPTRFYLDRSFTRQITEMGLAPHTQVLEISTGKISEDSPKVFQGQMGEPYCLLERLRFGDHQPIGLQSAMILTTLCPGLEKHDFESHSLYDVLNRTYNLHITEIQHTVSAITADDEKAALLQVEQGAPLLVVKTTAYVHDRTLIESTVSYYRADRYEYSTTHTFA